MLQALVRAGPEAVGGYCKTCYAYFAHMELRLVVNLSAQEF
jgi:hypothetical protein